MNIVKDAIDVLLKLDQIFLATSYEEQESTEKNLLDICRNISVEISDVSSSKIQYIFGQNGIKTNRYDLACCILDLLVMLENDENEKNQAAFSPPEAESLTEGKPHQPKNLINLGLLKAIKNGVEFIFYSIVLDCLEPEASAYYIMNASNKKWKLFHNNVPMKVEVKYEILRSTMKFLLSHRELEGYGEEIWKSLSPEYLCSLLQLSFSPRSYEEKCFFQTELGNLMQKGHKSFFLQQLLMLRSIQDSKSGNWLRTCVGSLISRRFIMQPNGVNLVIRIGMQNAKEIDWKKKEAIARIVTLSIVKDTRSFYESVGTQVVDLANKTQKNLEANEATEVNGIILHIVGFIIEQLAEKNAQLSRDFIYKELLAPLTDTTGTSEPSENKVVSSCVSLLHKLYVETMSPDCGLHSLIEPVLCPLMKLATMNSITHIKSFSLQIIIRYLSQLSDLECVSILMVLSELECKEHIPRVREEISFEFVDNAVRSCTSTERDLLAEDDRLVKCIVLILEKLPECKVTRQYFENVAKYIHFSANQTTGNSSTSNTHLLTEADKIETEFTYFRMLSKVASLLSCIAEHEKLIDHLFSDLEASHDFLSCLLQSAIRKTEDPKINSIQESLSLSVAMLLFSYMGERVSKGTATRSDWNTLNLLLPMLKSMKESTSDAALSSILNELIELILTHGSTASKSSLKSEPATASKYRETIDDLSSPYLPVKGHGIIALTRLIRNGDPEAIEKIDTAMQLFKFHLKNDDTYIYLAAIEGLATICDIIPEEAVPLLTKEFTDKQKLSSETRIKVIECLTKATNRLGEMLSKYKNYFLNSLMFGCRDQDDLIRASSLSSLGDVCSNLHFSLGPIVNEVFLTVHDAIVCDKSVSVRRAGVLVLTLILRGLDKSVLKVLNDILLQIYRFLKTLGRDPDDVIRLHAALAMEEIDNIAKSFLIPKINLNKKIYITEIPPTTFL